MWGKKSTWWHNFLLSPTNVNHASRFVAQQQTSLFFLFTHPPLPLQLIPHHIYSLFISVNTLLHSYITIHDITFTPYLTYKGILHYFHCSFFPILFCLHHTDMGNFLSIPHHSLDLQSTFPFTSIDTTHIVTLQLVTPSQKWFYPNQAG